MGLAYAARGLRAAIVTAFVGMAVLVVAMLVNGLQIDPRSGQTLGPVASSNLPRKNSSVSPSAPVSIPPPSVTSAHAGVRLQTGLEGLPLSLRGTEVDGAVTMDSQGRLIPTTQVRALFDYFLSLDGAEPQDTILNRLRAYIKTHSREPATTQSLDLLSRYVQLSEAMQNLKLNVTPQSSPAEILRAKQLVMGLRSQYLTPAQHQGFYGTDEAYDEFQIRRLEISNDSHLDALQKSQLLDREVQRLPVQLQASMAPAIQYESLQNVTQALQERGASPQVIHQAREQVVGKEAADRLDQLERTDQQWQQRVSQYLAARGAVYSQNGLSDEQVETQLTALRAGQFSEREQLRLPAYEQLAERGLTLDAMGNPIALAR